MKLISIPVVAVLTTLAVQATDAKGQVPPQVAHVRPLYNVQSDYNYGLRPRYVLPNPNYYRYHAATAAESYARGIAAMTYAQGQYNRLTAEARVIHSEAYRREVENAEMAAATYFAMREANREARAAERRPRPTSADLARWAEQATPDRLSSSQLDPRTGKVSWPELLQAEAFAPFRAELEKTFVERAAKGAVGAEKRAQARRAANAMLAELKKYIREVDSSHYLAARRFVESLAHEAQLPVI